MDPALLEEWMMTILVSVLIIFMAFIVWDLAKKSKAGRFGSFILFFVLGLGVVAFIIKSVVIALIESDALYPSRHFLVLALIQPLNRPVANAHPHQPQGR